MSEAIPSQFLLNKPMKLPDGIRTEVLRINPTNSLSTTQGQIISHTIPQISNAFLDPSTMYMSMQITFSGSNTAYTPSFLTGSFLLGTFGWSLFQRLQVYFGSQTLIDDIQNPGVIAHLLSKCHISQSEIGGMSAANIGNENTQLYGTATNGKGYPNTFLQLGGPDAGFGTLSAGTWTQNVNITFPMIGLIGVNQSKMVPLSFGNWRIDSTVDSLANFTQNLASNFTVTGWTINTMELVASIVYPPAESLAAIMAQAPVLYLTNHTYSLVTGNLPASAGAGLYQIPLSSSRASLRNVLVQTVPSNLPEKNFGGCAGNYTTSSCLLLNGRTVPQQGLDPCNKPSDCFMALQISNGSFADVLYNGCIGRSAYYRSSTAYGLMAAYNSTVANLLTAGNCFLLDICTERYSKRGFCMAGASMEVSSMMQLSVGSTLAAVAHTVNCWLVFDAILAFDMATGQVTKYQ